MLEYYGVVPRAIVPYNLKSAVQKGSRFSPILNETFESFSEHYSTNILPTRPRQPREKSLVEGTVKLVYQLINIYLQNKVFFSLEGLNEALKLLLASNNERAPLEKKAEGNSLISSNGKAYRHFRPCLTNPCKSKSPRL